jgi:hypothetical protein
MEGIQALPEGERRVRPGLLNRGEREKREERRMGRPAQDTQMSFGVSGDIRIIKIPRAIFQTYNVRTKIGGQYVSYLIKYLHYGLYIPSTSLPPPASMLN